MRASVGLFRPHPAHRTHGVCDVGQFAISVLGHTVGSKESGKYDCQEYRVPPVRQQNREP